MPSELALRLTGGVNNMDLDQSVGGETSAWPVDLVALFPTVGRHDGIHGQTLYRSLDLLNLGDQGAHRIRVWTAPGENLELGLSESSDVAPIQPGLPPWDHGHFVAFSGYSKAAPLEVPDILCGGKRRLWLKRIIKPRTRTGSDSEVLKVSYL